MTFLRYFKDIYKDRRTVFELSKKDISSRYLGSTLGAFWAFAHPLLLIITYWFVFQIGFRSFPIGEFPFILWLLAGIVPWFFFSESVSSATSAIEQNSFLVKKIVFKVHLLPVVKVVSAFFIHIVFLSITLLVFIFYGVGVDLYLLQVVYYTGALFLLVIGLTWLSSALNVFLKDVGQVIAIILQFGFWLTPIFWSYSMVPSKYDLIFKLNPIFYIVQGYRDSFINKVWFWEHYKITPYYWLITIILLLVGARLFKKLTPHFSDVL
ncbi:ABC transporter permease [Paenibacillus sp. FSL K6-3182]|uniref:ABC transporter permease n=1 Tax=Paenibacillus sp. FSL K6-3182 TaxID=2921495 RepID=UPI0030D2CE0E